MISEKDSIPRISDLDYLIDGLSLMQSSPTFDQVRKELISTSTRRATASIGIPRSGYNVTRRDLTSDDYTYWTNARDTISELVNLGLVAETPVPSKKKQVDSYRNQTYQISASGHQLLQLKGKDKGAFLDSLFERMYRHHPHIRHLISLLSRHNIYVPTYRVSDRLNDVEGASNSHIVNDAVEFFKIQATNYGLSNLDFKLLKLKLSELLSNDSQSNGSGSSKSRLVDVINDAAAGWFIRGQGLPFDSVTFDNLIRLMEQFHLLNFGYLRENAPVLVAFPTSEIETEPVFKVTRHTISQYVQPILDSLPEEYTRFGNPFVPIYDLRLAVCLKTKVNNEVFDEVVRQANAGKYNLDFQLMLMREMPGLMPPSAEPLVMNGQFFFRISLANKVKEEN